MGSNLSGCYVTSTFYFHFGTEGNVVKVSPRTAGKGTFHPCTHGLGLHSVNILLITSAVFTCLFCFHLAICNIKFLYMEIEFCNIKIGWQRKKVKFCDLSRCGENTYLCAMTGSTKVTLCQSKLKILFNTRRILNSSFVFKLNAHKKVWPASPT